MGRGTRAQPSRGRAKGEDGGGSPVPPQDDGADDGERVRYHVSVPLGMWEVRHVASLSSPAFCTILTRVGTRS